MRNPARTIDWSSATSTRIVTAFAAEREASGEHEPTFLRGSRAHLTTVELDAFADADEPVAEAVARCAAVAVVPYLDPQLVRPVADDHVRVARVRVPQCVGQALLDDPIRREVDSARKRERLTVDVQLDGQPGAADLVQQRVEAVQPGLRHELHFLTVASHRRQEASHLGQGHAPGALDALERIAVLVERIGQLVPDGADLEHHHADCVGDDVVELARDPRALLRHRDPRCCLTVAFGPDRAFLGGLGLVGALTQGVAGEPGDDEPKGDEDEVAGRRRAGAASTTFSYGGRSSDAASMARHNVRRVHARSVSPGA